MSDSDEVPAEKLLQFRKEFDKIVGQAILDGLISPESIGPFKVGSWNHGQGGHYTQHGGGNYNQSGEGEHHQTGGGDYTQGG